MIDKDLRYAQTHEWARLEDDGVTVGLSAYAIEQLGDIVYIELPAVGDELVKGESFGVIESVKAASDMCSPVSGKVTAVNDGIVDEPDILKTDTYGQGWLVKIEPADSDEYQTLLDADAYETFLKTQAD